MPCLRRLGVLSTRLHSLLSPALAPLLPASSRSLVSEIQQGARTGSSLAPLWPSQAASLQLAPSPPTAGFSPVPQGFGFRTLQARRVPIPSILRTPCSPEPHAAVGNSPNMGSLSLAWATLPAHSAPCALTHPASGAQFPGIMQSPGFLHLSARPASTGAGKPRPSAQKFRGRGRGRVSRDSKGRRPSRALGSEGEQGAVEGWQPRGLRVRAGALPSTDRRGLDRRGIHPGGLGRGGGSAGGLRWSSHPGAGKKERGGSRVPGPGAPGAVGREGRGASARPWDEEVAKGGSQSERGDGDEAGAFRSKKERSQGYAGLEWEADNTDRDSGSSRGEGAGRGRGGSFRGREYKDLDADGDGADSGGWGVGGRGDRGRGGGDWPAGRQSQGRGMGRTQGSGYRQDDRARGPPGGQDRGRGPGRSSWGDARSGSGSFSSDRGSYRGSDRGRDASSNRGTDRGSDRGNDRGSDRGRDRGRAAPSQTGFAGGVDGFREWQEKRVAQREAATAAGPQELSGRGWRQGDRSGSGERGTGEGSWAAGRGAAQTWDRAEGQRWDRGGDAWGNRSAPRERGAEEGEGFDDWEASTGRGGGGAPDLQGEVLYGVAPVQAALRAGKREVFALYVQEGLEDGLRGGRRKDKQAAAWLLREARSRGIPLEPASKHALNLLAGNRPHQGFILDAGPLDLDTIDCLPPVSLAPAPELPGAPEGSEGTSGERGAVWPPLWVVLDQVTDPQNLGAVLRSALFLGAAGVVVCQKNSAPLSAVVAKASAGALEAIPVLLCRSMTKFLAQSAANGWLTVGAAAERGAAPVRQLAADSQGVPLILVLGSEGAGLRTVVRRACSELVRIDNLAGPGPGYSTRKEEAGTRGAADGDEEGLEEAELYLEGSRAHGAPPDEADADADVPEEGGDSDHDESDAGSTEDDGAIANGVATRGQAGSGFQFVDSLNVSVATGILLHEFVSVRRRV